MQCILFSITKESIIDVQGVVRCPPTKIESCSQKDVELELKCVFVISAAKSQLPLQIEDAARPINEEAEETALNIRVNQDTRLDNRVLDLRTPANQAIFRVEAGVCKLFRDILTNKVSPMILIFISKEIVLIILTYEYFRRALWKFTLPKSSLQPVRAERTSSRYPISRETLI